MRTIRLLRWWIREGIPERWHRLMFRMNPWARARQYRIERDWWKQRLLDTEAGLGEGVGEGYDSGVMSHIGIGRQ